jgi:carbonyl reductase 1
MTSATAGRVAVITGSNKGIGYFIALQLGLSGLFQHILLACRDESLAKAAVESLKAQLPKKVQVSAELLTLGDTDSHQKLADRLASRFDNKIDVLVNNAAFAYKNSDPTPFQGQCQPTLDVNFRATVDLTERLLPLLRRGSDPRIVNVASMSGRLGQLSQERQAQFSSPELTISRLQELVHDFQASVLDGTHSEKGWGNSNYGMSKLAVVAATKVWARQEASAGIKVNCCCPGYCKTDMTSQNGRRDPADGAKNAVLPATMENPPTGEFFQDYKVSEW